MLRRRFSQIVVGVSDESLSHAFVDSHRTARSVAHSFDSTNFHFDFGHSRSASGDDRSVRERRVSNEEISRRHFLPPFPSSVDFRFDVIRWNFSNFSACIRLWLLMFGSTCSIVYYSFHFWAYKRLSLIPHESTMRKKSTSLRKKKIVSIRLE